MAGARACVAAGFVFGAGGRAGGHHAGAGYVSPGSAVVFGLVAGVACYWGATGLKRLLNADDSLDVFGVHGIGGIVGSLLTGVFASKTIQVLRAACWCNASVGVVMLYSLTMTSLLLWITSLFVGLRVSESAELDGPGH